MTLPPMNQPDPLPPAEPAAPEHSLADIHAANPQKSRSGLTRVWHAAGYSLQGLRAGWAEKAFRLEAMLALVLLPVSVWLARDWREWALLCARMLRGRQPLEPAVLADRLEELAQAEQHFFRRLLRAL